MKTIWLFAVLLTIVTASLEPCAIGDKDAPCTELPRKDQHVQDFLDQLKRILDATDAFFPEAAEFTSVIKYFLTWIPSGDPTDPMQEIKDEIGAISEQISEGFTDLKYLIERTQLQNQIKLPAEKLNAALKSYMADKSNPNRTNTLLTTCAEQAPCSLAKFFSEEILIDSDKKNYMINVTLQQCNYGYNEYKNFRKLLTRLALSLMHSCSYCEELQGDSPVVLENIGQARVHANDVLAKLKAGTDYQKALFWPAPCKTATTEYIKEKANLLKDASKAAPDVFNFILSKYMNASNETVHSENFGVLVASGYIEFAGTNDNFFQIDNDDKHYVVYRFSREDTNRPFMDAVKKWQNNRGTLNCAGSYQEKPCTKDFLKELASVHNFPMFVSVPEALGSDYHPAEINHEGVSYVAGMSNLPSAMEYTTMSMDMVTRFWTYGHMKMHYLIGM